MLRHGLASKGSRSGFGVATELGHGKEAGCHDTAPGVVIGQAGIRTQLTQ